MAPPVQPSRGLLGFFGLAPANCDIAETTPDRRAGHPGDDAVASRVKQAFLSHGFPTTIDRFEESGTKLANVIGRRPGSSSKEIVVLAARDASGVPDEAGSAADTAALIEFARVFEGRASRRTLVLASVDGSQLGEAGVRRFAETISNPLLKVCDIDACAEVAREAGARLLVDNTFASPYLCRPLEHRADMVVHSATKYLAGLQNGEIPLDLLFSGTVFYVGADGRLQVNRISWNAEASHRLPVSVWRNLMEENFPEAGWLRMHRDTVDALARYRHERGLAGWDAVVTTLLAEAGHTGAGRSDAGHSEALHPAGEGAGT